ncbi:hypothetical protein FA15DRAFT_655895 [Coprinopsis marcescibilis]|uniref:Meiotically up-regulated protein Msb1/Mug8 domain-containing protein n=1 Tax=Coprinopsis marcescibilis TaxID=230819 RepID=A0A5C3KUY5_COPMA|nr:hypothetical protein FA15DRAFT_655895 [Coprinopsis marcescibilis]
MPSLFSRARTFSTPQKKSVQAQDDGLDEFGRVASPTAHRSATLGTATPSKKDKKKSKEQTKRSGTLPNLTDQEFPGESPFPDGSFLPLNLERPRNDSDTADQSKQLDYGYLCNERHVVLGIEQLERLVEVVAEELETRGGITTPFIFSNTALDISASGVRRLIHSFINTCAPRNQQEAQVADLKWREEARFAGPHELGMCLRWGLARVIRSVGGQDVRGLVSYEQYIQFRDSEITNGYPSTHFQTFLPVLLPPLQYIVVRLLSLLARLVANSTSSGHTPPTLSPLFGPLFFGLGPATLAFHHTYIHYLRSVNAFEHLLLAFVRWQDTPRASTASAASLGVPVRLKEWIKGYPSMLPVINPKSKPQPRKGARTVRVMSVRRNVRMYSPDLVKSGSAWAQKLPNSNLPNSFALSREWERIAPNTLKLPPRYSDAYRKKMNLSGNFHPDVSHGTAPPVSLSSTLSSTFSSSTDVSDNDYFGLNERKDERFRSLTDLKWGEFEDCGFNNLGDDKRLQFDLTESARQERAAKRQTLSWNDFSSAGFSRMDAPLSATLQFSTPLVNTVSQWPANQVEIHRKLKKQQKSLPAFGWDTEPVVGTEEVIEEAFVDVFVDLIYGGGWMDLERGESLDRDCNWALVEYKALAPSRTTASGGSDPRTDTTLILYEEFVPLEYRQQLALPSKSRRRLPSLFSPSSKKQWKQAATLNGQPYVLGNVPRSQSFRELEFEGLLQGSNATKVISLSKRDTQRLPSANPPSRTPANAPPLPDLPIPPAPARPAPTPVLSVSTSPRLANPSPPPPPKSDELSGESQVSTPSQKRSRFRLPVSPNVRRSMMGPPAEYSTVEFETRMASYSDDEYNGDSNEPEDVKQKRRESRPDAWVDILVGTHERRMGGQDAALLDPVDRRRGAHLRKSDPDMASLEVAQVLAAVEAGRRSVSPSSVPDEQVYGIGEGLRVDRDYGVDRHVFGEVDERRVRHMSSSEDLTSEEAGLAYDGATNEGSVDEEVGTIMNARQMAKEGRRLGYFDLHPERRTALTVSRHEEDPRDVISRDSVFDDGDDAGVALDESPKRPEGRRPLPAPPVPGAPVTPSRAVPDIKITTNADLSSPIEKSPSGEGKGPTSKTAALIEMYREKERSSTVPVTAPLNVVPIPVAPLNVSRLPVRTASLPAAPKAPAAVVATPSPTPSPKASPPEVLPVLVPAGEDPGRVSPARYVHGAPLHNVIEEEEED